MDPFPLYHRLQREAPLYYDSATLCWIATGYHAISTILAHEHFSSELSRYSPPSAMSSEMINAALQQQVFFKDGPEHRAAHFFLFQQVAKLVKNLTDSINTLIAAQVTRVARQGSLDIINDIAAPISLSVIAQLLGVPFKDQEQMQQFRQWADTFSDVSSGYPAGQLRDILQLKNYFHRLVAAKRRAPTDDLISACLGEPTIFRTEEAIVASCMMLLSAGYITTRKAIGTGVVKLLGQWEDFREALATDPNRVKLISEELLRISTPTRYIVRWADSDVDLSASIPEGPVIAKGQKVFCFLEAGNYDPQLFPDASHFHLNRRPNKHITFGHGIHACPGAALARLEVQSSLTEISQLADLVSDKTVSPHWNHNPNLGGFLSHQLLFQVKQE